MLEALRNFSRSKVDLDGMLELRAFSRLMKAEYSVQSLDTPEWLTKVCFDLDDAIKFTVRDELARKLSEARSRRQSLLTADEKRNILDGEINRLEEALK